MTITRKPILITGSPRSGSTWAGRMLNLSGTVGYLHEPFNPSYRNTIYPEIIPHKYLYISDHNEAEYLNHFERQINFRHQPADIIRALINTKKIKNGIGEYRRIRQCDQLGFRALLKDPIALFSSEWLADRFDADVLVLIRHPAAYVASNLQKKSWKTDFKLFLKQSQLMERFDLYRYEDAMLRLSQDSVDLLESHCLMWNICYDVVDQLRQTHEDWIFLKHEALSLDPVKHYQKIYEAFSLPYSPETQQAIRDASSSSNKGTANGIFDVKIDSKANIKQWKNRLSEAQILKIKELTADVSAKYYDESDW